MQTIKASRNKKSKSAHKGEYSILVKVLKIPHYMERTHHPVRIQYIAAVKKVTIGSGKHIPALTSNLAIS